MPEYETLDPAIELRIYEILSMLFLDTCVDTNLIAWALLHLKEPVPVPTLEYILRYQLFGVLFPNTLSIAGEWIGFDSDWLFEMAQARKQAGWLQRIGDTAAWYAFGYTIWPSWKKVKEILSRYEDPLVLPPVSIDCLDHSPLLRSSKLDQ